MSARRKQRKLPPAHVLEKRRGLRITLTFEQAAELVSYTLTEPLDFVGRALEAIASDLNGLTMLLLTEGADPDESAHLVAALCARVEFAVRINAALKKAGAA